jgi:hypothetical protein
MGEEDGVVGDLPEWRHLRFFGPQVFGALDDGVSDGLQTGAVLRFERGSNSFVHVLII